MTETKFVFPSSMTDRELKYLGRKSCPPSWPWLIIGLTLGLTLYHFLVLPLIVAGV